MTRGVPTHAYSMLTLYRAHFVNLLENPSLSDGRILRERFLRVLFLPAQELRIEARNRGRGTKVFSTL